ncbi:cupin domain-containing protein [Rubrobacter indicoceani]|uniref:cupin domain-containing protein n=1 Tax=Rubrobacter indicoceani TaxID=2051957 RepID=UPI000E5A8AD0|nr:cupin domain-containing protein [Rubrobacter indicoceani]
MNSKNIRDVARFSEEKMQKNSFFDSDKLFYDAYCLKPGQAQKVHAHDSSDKVYFVVSGTGSFTIGDETKELGEGNAVMAKAGERHGVANESDKDLTLLVTMAPPPTH